MILAVLAASAFTTSWVVVLAALIVTLIAILLFSMCRLDLLGEAPTLDNEVEGGEESDNGNSLQGEKERKARERTNEEEIARHGARKVRIRRTAQFLVAGAFLAAGLVGAPIVVALQDAECSTFTELFDSPALESSRRTTTGVTAEDGTGAGPVDEVTTTATRAAPKTAIECEQPTLSLTSPIVMGGVALAAVVLLPAMSEVGIPGLLSLKLRVEAQKKDVDATRKETEALQTKVEAQVMRIDVDNRNTNALNINFDSSRPLVEVGDVTLAATVEVVDMLDAIQAKMSEATREMFGDGRIQEKPTIYVHGRGDFLTPLAGPLTSDEERPAAQIEIQLAGNHIATEAWRTRQYAASWGTDGSRRAAMLAVPLSDGQGLRYGVVLLSVETAAPDGWSLENGRPSGAEEERIQEWVDTLVGLVKARSERLMTTMRDRVGVVAR